MRMPAGQRTAYLSLGSNLGEKDKSIRKALVILGKTPGISVVRYSSLYLTEPAGISNQPDFLNCVVMIKTSLAPHLLLETIKDVESELGREPDSHFLPRPIDIDILLFSDLEIDSLELMIPHSRMTKRAFVLVPLLEISPDLIHPKSLKPFKEYLAEIEPAQRVEKMIDAAELFERAEED